MTTRISAGVDDCPCFIIAMIPINCKIANFFLTLVILKPHYKLRESHKLIEYH